MDLQHVSSELLHTIMKPGATAQELWKRLQEIFQDNKATRAVYLEEQFNTTRLESFSNISDYSARLKSLSDQLASVGNPISETKMVLQLVSGLTKGEYDAIATFIQQSDPLPSFNKARSQLLLEETRHTKQETHAQHALVTQRIDSTHTPSDAPPPRSTPNNRRGHTRGGRTPNRGTYRGRGRGRSSHQQQHWPSPQQNWYRPQTWTPPSCPFPTVSQFSQPGLLGPRPTYRAPSTTQQPVHYAPQEAHFTADAASTHGYPLTPTELTAALHTIHLQPRDISWCMDTGSTSHLTNDPGKLSNFVCLSTPHYIRVGNGIPIPINGHGNTTTTTSINFPFRLNQVHHVPHIIKYLISVGKFTRDNQVSIEFDPFGFSMKALNTGRIITRCNSSGELYPLTQASHDTSSPIVLHAASPTTWHNRLGHQNISTLSPIPTNPKVAMLDQNWKDAMLTEYNALLKQHTWELVPRPTDTNIIRCHWLFRHKFRSDGTLERYKARLVVNGKSQEVRVDCDQTFSPVVKPSTIRIVLSLAMGRKWDIHQLDVKNVFLHGDLHETVFMHQPLGFCNPSYPDYVCKHRKSLYGLKQAPRAWYQKFAAYLIHLGFVCSKSDTSLFIYKHNNELAYLLLYVDDIVLTTSSSTLKEQIIQSLKGEFDMTDLGPLSYFLGVSVTRTANTMFLSQRKYTEAIIKRATMENCKPVATPVDTNSKLSLSAGKPVDDPSLYRSLAGALQYLTFTLPDISYAVQQICLFMHEFKGLSANCGSAREVVAVVVFRCRSYQEVANVVAEACWLRNLLLELHVSIRRATMVYCNNVSAVYLFSNPVRHQCTKHIEMDIHFVREKVAIGHVRVLHIPSAYQYADIFTKGLPRQLFLDFRSNLSIRPPPAQTAGAY
ncbi:hypothetical protein OSB04_018522 [Centaurea solstitialis]|uniref:Reverse transcriptase Ty1/copia-type domain-containing protein n=1 Tax=Centaurea solstitialis TaxID=347529 RepID=A0AA38WBM7_9ASTR|nr:hypothetical protein OSB04_018522 [Centaurea solstitialis]